MPGDKWAQYADKPATDKWAQYAQSSPSGQPNPGVGAAISQNPISAGLSGMVDQAESKVGDWWRQAVTQPSQFSYYNPLHYFDTLGKGMAMGAQSLAHPVDTAKQMYQTAMAPHPMDFSDASYKPLLQQAKEGADTLMENYGQAATISAAAQPLRAAPDYAQAAFRGGLKDAGHLHLDDAMTVDKKAISDSVVQAKESVGGTINKIWAADLAKSPDGRGIVASDIWPKLDELSEQYPGQLPKFAKVAAGVSEQPSAMSWKDLHNLKQQVGGAWAGASLPKDAAALNDLYKFIDGKLAARADELGMSEDYAAYNKTYRTIKDYESGQLGKLLNTAHGIDYYNMLSDPKTGAPLQNTLLDLQEFGLPENLRKNFLADHRQVYNFVKETGGGPIKGKVAAIKQHPVAGLAGAGIGSALGAASHLPAGSFIGGYLGATKMAELADRVGAMREMKAQGGIPKPQGQLTQEAPIVMRNRGTPRPTTESSGAPVDPAAVSQVVDAVKYRSPKLDPKAAKAQAIQLLRQSKGDVNAATDAALRAN